MGIHNNSLIGAGGQQSFQITRSLRFRRTASGYFTRTPASAGNRTTWTWSGWVKRGSLSVSDTGGVIGLFGAGTLGTSQSNFFFYFNTDNTIYLQETVNNVSNQLIFTTTPTFRDPSAWYHIIIAMDTTQATAANRVRVYVNGSLIAGTFGLTPSQNQALSMNNNVPQYIGGASVNPQAYGNVLSYFDGYMAELNFVEGYPTVSGTTYDATSWAALNVATLFGQTNSITGVWEPKLYRGTYGTNGYYLKFTDNSASTAATIGKDSSVNSNNWTPNAGISVAPGVTYDSMLDTPTPYNDGGNGRGNYCTWNPSDRVGTTTSSGNLNADYSASGFAIRGTMAFPSTGKWYYEMQQFGTGDNFIGLASVTATIANLSAGSTGLYAYYGGGFKYTSGSSSAYGATFTTGDVIGVAVDSDAGTVTFYKNNASQGVAFTALDFSTGWLPMARVSGSGVTAQTNFGQRPFTYTPPTGFKALNTQNLPEPAILNGASHMAATAYTGTGAIRTVSNAVNGVSFQPDFVWIKGRSVATDHVLTDAVRGATKEIKSNTTGVETTAVNGMTAFNSGGFSVGTAADYNTNAATHVAWQWKAGNTAVTNTSGTISSQVSANPTAGFSVVTYTGTGANATVGHGLGVAPKMVILKPRSIVSSWIVWHNSFAGTEYIVIDSTAAKASLAAMWNSTTPTSSVFSIGTNANVNQNAQTFVAYCFSEVAGYSKFGTYTGNLSATDGPFVYTGFRPRFVMCKRTDSTSHWPILDSSRAGYNNANNDLYASLAQGEATSAFIDILSNGFKLHAVSGEINGNGGTYMYMAFAENPFKNSLAR